jgi:protein TonB
VKHRIAFVKKPDSFAAMRLIAPIFTLSFCLLLSACAGVALPSLPGQSDEGRGPFFPRDDYPVPPYVAGLIGPEDCQGSTLAAMDAPLPEYPERAYVRGRQGWVVVRFHVYSDGSVHRTRVARAVPDGPFNRAALRAVSNWQFRPLEGVDILRNCVVMFEFRTGEVRIR